MYKCKICDITFDRPRVVREKHRYTFMGLGLYEEFDVCPACGNDDFEEVEENEDDESE